MRGKRFKSINKKYLKNTKMFLIQCSYLYLLGEKIKTKQKTALPEKLEYRSQAEAYAAGKIAHHCLRHRTLQSK